MTAENSKENIKDVHIRIPANLAERVKAFASDKNSTVDSVVIEALAIFLREQHKADQ